MVEVFPNPEEPAPEEITQQVGRKPPEAAEVEITQQTRIKQPGSEGSTLQEPAAPETVVVSTKPSAAALQPPRRTFFSRLGHALFSPQTRFGRFTRSVFATLVTVVFLFGVWAIAAYFLIYRPMTTNLATLRVDATRTADQLQRATSAQKSAEQKAQAASTQSALDQSQLLDQQSHVDLLRAISAIAGSRLALTEKDLNAAAQGLSDAQGFLNGAYPWIEKQNPKQVETLKALFTVANNDLSENLSAVSGTTSESASGVGSTPTVDTLLVDQDLVRIQTELERVEKTMK